MVNLYRAFISKTSKSDSLIIAFALMYKLTSRVRAPFKPPRPLSTVSEPSREPIEPVTPVPDSGAKSDTRSKRNAETSVDTIASSPASSQLTAESSQKKPNLGKKYLIQWRKVKNKKIKTWDGDGVIYVNGDTVTAKIDNRSITKSIPKIDGIFKIGSYEVEIDCAADEVDAPSAPVIPQKTKLSLRLAPIPQFKKLMPQMKPVKKKVVYPKDENSFVMKKQNPSDTDVIVDPKLDKLLRPHQREGVKFMYEGVMGYSFEGNGVLLADEMGLGKTLMSITLIWTLLKQSPDPSQHSVVNKLLIVCPVTLINNWKKEFKKWLNINQIGILVVDNNSTDYKQDLRGFIKSSAYQVLIMSYERLHNCEEELLEIDFDLLICDEGHKLKNNSNKSLKILNNLNIPKKVLLSGTPIQNNLNEFYTLINFINPGVLGSFASFQKNFIKPIEQSREVNCYSNEIKLLGKEASKELSNITKQFILRRTNEILFKYLNSKTDILLFAKPTAQQLQLFDQILSNVSFSDYDNNNILNLINVFKKICNSPLLLKDDSLFSSVVSNQPELQTSSGKIDLLVMLLIEIINNKKEKVVLVSNYTKTLDLLESILRKLNFEFLRLDGSTNSNTRSSIINQFNMVSFPRYPIFLLSSKSGGFGINLIGASRLILFDNDWNPSNDLQAMSRIYRDGQTKPVFIYRLFTTGCLDEKIFQRQLMKNNLSDKFLNNSKTNLNVFDMNDLKDLFTVHELTDCNTHDLLECECDGLGNTQEVVDPDVSVDDLAARSSSLLDGWMSALNYSQLDQTNTKKKNSIRNALSDYKHHSSSDKDFNCCDDVVNSVVSKTKDKMSITYVFTKVSNAEIKDQESEESEVPDDSESQSTPLFVDSDAVSTQ